MHSKSFVWIHVVSSVIGLAGCSLNTPSMGHAKFKELVSHYDASPFSERKPWKIGWTALGQSLQDAIGVTMASM